MFCSNCGTEAIEGAVFCQKCGAKLVQENNGVQEPVPATGSALKPRQTPVMGEELVCGNKSISVSVPEPIEVSADRMDSIQETAQEVHIQEEVPSISGSDSDIYELLKENAYLCPAIKSTKQLKKRIQLRGRICSHSVKLVSVHAVQTRLRSVLAFPFSILYGLLAGVFFITAWIIIADLVKYGSIYREYYHGILLALLCLVVGAIVFIHTFVGRKEKDDIEKYVRGISESRQIYLSERKWAGASTIKIVAAVVLVVAGVIILPLSWPEPLAYPDELLFDGIPAEHFLEMTQKDIESEFEEADPLYQNEVTGDDWYEYDDYGIEHVTYSRETGKVMYIEFNPTRCSYNRKNLYRSMERVLDILTEEYWYCVIPMRYALEVYGSIHSGFYYYDGEYISEYVSMDFREQHGLGQSTHYLVFPLHTFGEKDYKIALITYRLEGNHRPLIVYSICLYTDEWVETVNASSENSDDTNTEFCYDDISVSELIGFSAVEIV